MANLYRKPVVTRDPATGEKVKTQSKKWWGQFKDAQGRLRRHPLAVDKMAAQAMLNELVRQVEREKAGLVDPTDRQRKRPLAQHIKEFRVYLENKGVTAKQTGESVRQIEKIAAGRKWTAIADVTASSALEYLGDLRRKGRSAQTYNHYLKSLKQFTRWLVSDRRTPSDPLAHVARLNVATDRRHDRRALTLEELNRLIEAAKVGKRIEDVAGRDRAMLYVLAAWTGFRKGELGSLTPKSLRLDDDPPTATVAASYSKRRREDSQVLHPDVAAQLRVWLRSKPRLKPDSLLFPISGRVPGGTDRKTHKMMARDLAAARNKWIKEGTTGQERKERENSEFLAHCNTAGLYADFHSLRHFFITSLERSAIAQDFRTPAGRLITPQ